MRKIKWDIYHCTGGVYEHYAIMELTIDEKDQLISELGEAYAEPRALWFNLHL